MKKIIFILCLFLLIMIVPNVKAITNDGKIYEVFYEESGVNVFAKDNTYKSMDYNGWMIVSDTNNYIYYCIDPATYMQNINDAKSNSHTIIEGDNNILNSINIESADLNRIKLLAYYGYGYKDNKVDHTSKKWYGITQVLIWRTIRSDINWQFKTSRYGSINNGLYLNEIGELLNLVYNHNLKPSFDNSNIEILTGEKIVLTDSNNVLSYYSIKDDDYASYEIKDNNLTITAKQNGILNVKLSRIKIDNKFTLLSSNQFQDIIIRGNVENNDSNFNLTISDGKLILNKLNENNQFSQDLINTIFNIYNENNEFVKEVTIKDEQEEINLPYGNYYLKEISCNKEYILDNNIYKFIVSEKNPVTLLKIINKRLRGNILITKKDYDSFLPIKDTLIGVFKNDGTLILEAKTNDNGEIFIEDLLYGKYYIQELKSSKYYRLNDEKKYFEINTNNKTINIEILNQKKEGQLILIKKEQNTDKLLSNALIEIYYKNSEKLIYSDYTDSNGKLFLKNIKAGEYYIIEKKAPYGYIKNREKIEFEITDDNQIIELSLFNNKIEMPNTSVNKPSVIKYLLLLFLFNYMPIMYEKK